MKLTHILILGASAAITVAMAGCYINTAGKQPAQQPPPPAAQPAATPAPQQPAQPQATTPPQKKTIGKWGSKAKPQPSTSSSAVQPANQQSPAGAPTVVLIKMQK